MAKIVLHRDEFLLIEDRENEKNYVFVQNIDGQIELRNDLERSGIK